MYDPQLEERIRKLEGYAEKESDPKEPPDFRGDKVGVGRYILCFLLAGFLGLLAAYWARYYGWRCVWISAAIWVALVVIFSLAAAQVETCYYDTWGNYVCD